MCDVLDLLNDELQQRRDNVGRMQVKVSEMQNDLIREHTGIERLISEQAKAIGAVAVALEVTIRLLARGTALRSSYDTNMMVNVLGEVEKIANYYGDKGDKR